MEIKSFNKVLTLFMLLMIFRASSADLASYICKAHCIKDCLKDRSPILCCVGCFHKCKSGGDPPAPSPPMPPPAVASKPTPAPPSIDQCDLNCVTSRCLVADTDAERAKACVDQCSNDCKKSNMPH